MRNSVLLAAIAAFAAACTQPEPVDVSTPEASAPPDQRTKLCRQIALAAQFVPEEDRIPGAAYSSEDLVTDIYTLTAELPVTRAERARLLDDRRAFEGDAAMLIDADRVPGRPPTMQSVRQPLDVLTIDESGYVAFIDESLAPGSAQPLAGPVPRQGVTLLALPAGAASRIGVIRGNTRLITGPRVPCNPFGEIVVEP